MLVRSLAVLIDFLLFRKMNEKSLFFYGLLTAPRCNSFYFFKSIGGESAYDRLVTTFTYTDLFFVLTVTSNLVESNTVFLEYSNGNFTFYLSTIY